MPSVTASSVGTAATIRLDHMGKDSGVTTVFGRFASSTSSNFFFFQGTLDDPAVVTSPTWFGLSTNSATFYSSAPVTYAASTHFDQGVAFSIQTPLAAVRLNSTGLSSSTIVLTTLQIGSY